MEFYFQILNINFEYEANLKINVYMTIVYDLVFKVLMFRLLFAFYLD